MFVISDAITTNKPNELPFAVMFSCASFTLISRESRLVVSFTLIVNQLGKRKLNISDRQHIRIIDVNSSRFHVDRQLFSQQHEDC